MASALNHNPSIQINQEPLVDSRDPARASERFQRNLKAFNSIPVVSEIFRKASKTEKVIVRASPTPVPKMSNRGKFAQDYRIRQEERLVAGILKMPHPTYPLDECTELKLKEITNGKYDSQIHLLSRLMGHLQSQPAGLELFFQSENTKKLVDTANKWIHSLPTSRYPEQLSHDNPAHRDRLWQMIEWLKQLSEQMPRWSLIKFSDPALITKENFEKGLLPAEIGGVWV